jgi:hypothetical protein
MKFYFCWEREFLFLRGFQKKKNSDFVLCSISLLAFTIEMKYIYCARENESFEYNVDQYSSL